MAFGVWRSAFGRTGDDAFGTYGLRSQRVLGKETGKGLKDCWCLRTPKSDVEELAHDSATDSPIRELSALENGDPGLKGFAPTPSDGGRQVQGFR